MGRFVTLCEYVIVDGALTVTSVSQPPLPRGTPPPNASANLQQLQHPHSHPPPQAQPSPSSTPTHVPSGGLTARPPSTLGMQSPAAPSQPLTPVQHQQPGTPSQTQPSSVQPPSTPVKYLLRIHNTLIGSYPDLVN